MRIVKLNHRNFQVRETDIEKLLEHLKKNYGIRKSVGYQVIMDIETHISKRVKVKESEDA